MHWMRPSWLWAEILPLLVLSAAVVGYGLQRRRLERFGDCQVLGVSDHTIRRAASALLLAFGIACVAAVPAGPYREEQDVAMAVPAIEILLDFKSAGESKREAESLWEDLCDSVDSLVALSPSCRFSVYCAGNPLELLVPETLDAQGLLLVLNGTLPPNAGGRPDRLQEALAALLPRKARNEQRSVVVVSTRTREELTRLSLLEAQPAVNPLFLRIAAETGFAEYGIHRVKGGWSWSRQPAFLRSYLDSSMRADQQRPSLWGRFSAMQFFAFAGFFLLSVECICPLLVRSSDGGKFLG